MEINKIRKYYCEHNKPKRFCKDCHGSQICPHNKQKSYCRECSGRQFCLHNRRKSNCKDCHGSNICQHNKVKQTCKDCHGSNICQHNISKQSCKECGYKLCEHNKKKSNCRECGTSYCQHNKGKRFCIECKGSGVCLHNKQKRFCIHCEGSDICTHNKQKSRCKICGGSSLCKTELCETRGIPKYNGYCLPCCIQVHPEITVSRNYKTKEKDVVDRITQTFTDFTWVADKKIQDGCSLRRPDLLLDMGSHIIIVEIDENKHTQYDCSCENKRLMQISQDLQHRPIVFIRFNPDGYTNNDGVLIKSCWKLNKMGVVTILKTKQIEWEQRIESLKQQIQYWIDNPVSKTIEIIELFY